MINSIKNQAEAKEIIKELVENHQITMVINNPEKVKRSRNVIWTSGLEQWIIAFAKKEMCKSCKFCDLKALKKEEPYCTFPDKTAHNINGMCLNHKMVFYPKV